LQEHFRSIAIATRHRTLTAGVIIGLSSKKSNTEITCGCLAPGLACLSPSFHCDLPPGQNNTNKRAPFGMVFMAWRRTGTAAGVGTTTTALCSGPWALTTASRPSASRPLAPLSATTTVLRVTRASLLPHLGLRPRACIDLAILPFVWIAALKHPALTVFSTLLSGPPSRPPLLNPPRPVQCPPPPFSAQR